MARRDGRRAIRRRRRRRSSRSTCGDIRATSGVGPVAAMQLDDELIGLAPVKSRIREIAALLLVDRVAGEVRPDSRSRRPCT